MPIQTVCGTIDQQDAGFTLMHEHLYGDFWTTYYSNVSLDDTSVHQPITLQNIHLLRRDPGSLSENLILKDVDLTIREVRRFVKSGGSVIVDVTPCGASPSPTALKIISDACGVHIVAATGYYVSYTLSKEVRSMSVQEMARLSIRDITQGYEGTDIRAGIIGEVGAVGEMDDLEKKILQATAITQKETGACVLLHTACPNTLYASKVNKSWGVRALEVLDYLEKHGCDLSRIIVGHPDASVRTTMDEQLNVLKTGVVLEYDNFGQEHSYDKENTYGLSDWQRVENIIELIERGYGERLVMATDTWQKAQYVEYGGFGFAHIHDNICPMLKRNGVTQKQIQQITILTPRKLLNM